MIQIVCLCRHVVLGHETLALVLKVESHPDSAQLSSLPLNVLEHECTSKVGEGRKTPIPVSLSIVPKIVNDQVLLRLSYRIIIDNTKDLQSQVRSMDCRRYHDIAFFKEQCLGILRQAFQGRESGGERFGFSEVGACAHCASDARVRMMR